MVFSPSGSTATRACVLPNALKQWYDDLSLNADFQDKVEVHCAFDTPAAPTTVTPGPASLSVEWGAYSYTGQPTFTTSHYEIQYRPGTTGEWDTVTIDKALTTTTITKYTDPKTKTAKHLDPNQPLPGSLPPPSGPHRYGPLLRHQVVVSGLCDRAGRHVDLQQRHRYRRNPDARQMATRVVVQKSERGDLHPGRCRHIRHENRPDQHPDARHGVHLQSLPRHRLRRRRRDSRHPGFHHADGQSKRHRHRHHQRDLDYPELDGRLVVSADHAHGRRHLPQSLGSQCHGPPAPGRPDREHGLHLHRLQG